jgi:hypothetical protein
MTTKDRKALIIKARRGEHHLKVRCPLSQVGDADVVEDVGVSAAELVGRVANFRVDVCMCKMIVNGWEYQQFRLLRTPS